MNCKEALLVALQFLTILPVTQREMPLEKLAQATGAFPLVGALIGLLLFGMWWLLRYIFPPFLANALLLAFWIAITGGLHLDGFVDCCDALLVAKSPQDRLNILKDTTVGAYGVIGAATLLIVKFTALVSLPAELHRSALILSPTLGRWAIVYSIAHYPYARCSGMGKPLKDALNWQAITSATITALAAILLVRSWIGLSALGIAYIFCLLFAHWVTGRIPGLTGDVYGALCELVEVIVLLTFIAARRG